MSMLSLILKQVESAVDASKNLKRVPRIDYQKFLEQASEVNKKILSAIRNNPGSSMREISDLVNIDAQNMSLRLYKMRKKGLLTCEGARKKIYYVKEP